MRITCPGCGSVFDVPDRAVPHPGRDVQCASCGTSWFLLRSAGAVGAAVAPADAVRDREDTVRSDGPADQVADGAPVDPRPPRRVAPEVLAILRAEAETERRARQTADAPPRAAKPTASGADRAAGPAPATDAARVSRPPQPADGGDDPYTGTKPDAPGRTRTVGGYGDIGARDRLARLTAAERRQSVYGGDIPASGGFPGQVATDGHDPAGTGPGQMGTRAGAEDHGLVEDPGAAQRDPRPPRLRDDLPGVQHRGGGTSDGAASRSTLPVMVPLADQRALVILRGRRRGFRLGFGATVGLCCGALGLYVLALNGGDRMDGALAETVRHHGGNVQAALVDWLRRVVAPALS